MQLRHSALVVATLLMLGCSGKSLDSGVLPADPDQARPPPLAWWSRAALDAYLRFEAWRGNRSGFVVMFARDGWPVHANAMGWADIAGQRPMRVNTPMRFASMTKPVTAVAAMQLVEAGVIHLDDPVAKYLPAFRDIRVATDQARDRDGGFATEPARVPMTIRHLLTFSSGIGPGRDEPSDLWQHWQANGPRSLASGSLAERIDHLATLPLFENPGTRWRYGWSADVLARVVEAASGEAFDAYLQAHIFVPLGMSNTRFLLSFTDRAALAAVYTQDASGELVPVTPDSDVDFPEGGSGLISTAPDYLRFALMLWNEGEYRGARVLRTETVQEMRRLHVTSGVLTGEGIEGVGWGLGMAVTADAKASRTPDRDGDFWWAGYFGTTFFVSPATGLVGVLLSQNEPGPYSDDPVAIYIAQALAFAGL